jgi:hypothetical protein
VAQFATDYLSISAASCRVPGKPIREDHLGERKIVLEVAESYFEILILTVAYIYPPIDMIITVLRRSTDICNNFEV